MVTASNGLVQKVLAGLVLASLLAGAGALVTQAQLATEVKANSKAIEKASDAQIKIREDVAIVKTKVSATEEEVKANGGKLDDIRDLLMKRQ